MSVTRKAVISKQFQRSKLRPLGLIVMTTAFALAAGPALSQSAAAPYTTGYRYDHAQRLVGVIHPDPDGTGPLYFAAVRNTYDSRGLLTRVEEGELAPPWPDETVAPSAWTGFSIFRQTDYTYDIHGRKLSEQVSSGGVAYTLQQFSYDTIGRLDCTALRMNTSAFATDLASLTACQLGAQGTHGPDRITRIQLYDTSNRPLNVLKAYGTPIQQTYAAYTYSGAHMASLEDANGNIETFQVDGLGRAEFWYFPSPTTTGQTSSTDFEQYSYDNNGNRRSYRKRDGSIINYNYDALNRMTLKDIPGATSADVYYDYDLRGLQRHALFGSASGLGIATVYDGFGRVSSSTNTMGAAPLTLSYSYDADGNRTQVTHPDGSFFKYFYDGLDRVNQIAENGVTTLISIGYNAQGLRSTMKRGANVASTTYQYDQVYRLKYLAHDLDGSSAVNDVTQQFSYIASGQIGSRNLSNGEYAYNNSPTVANSYGVNGLNQYISISGSAPATPTWDPKGNLKFDGSVTYAYDVENRLITATGGRTANLYYDPMGRLYETNAGTTASDTRYLYDGDALVGEYNSSGTLLKRYVHSSGVDEPLVSYGGSIVGASNRNYYFQNHQGSIVAISNSAGTTSQINTYDAYGTSGANAGRFQYTGQIVIPEIGMYYYKARIYSAALGRFLQTDPIGYSDDADLYSYVGNDPLDDTDPSGMANCRPDDPTCVETPNSARQPGDPPEKTGDTKQMEEVVVTAQRNRKDSDGNPISFGDGAEHTFTVGDDRIGRAPMRHIADVNCGGGVSVQVNGVSAPPGSTIGHTHPDSFGSSGSVPGPQDGGAARSSAANTAFVMTSSNVFTIESFSNGTFRSTVSGGALSAPQRAALVSSMQNWESPVATAAGSSNQQKYCGKK